MRDNGYLDKWLRVVFALFRYAVYRNEARSRSGYPSELLQFARIASEYWR